MGKNPERVAKPRNGLYQKIQNYTQHPRFAPKSLSWFMCYFDESGERVKHAVDYLVFKRFLMVLPSGRYGVDRDMRKRVTGRVFMVHGFCYVEPDAECGYSHTVFIPEKYTFGARHGDRVKVALDGYNASGEGAPTGVIEEITAPLSDRFCGRIGQDEKGFFVVPDFLELGARIDLQNPDADYHAGEYVYAELVNGDARRKAAFLHASFSQQKQNLSARIWGEEWKDAELFEAPEPVCRIISRVSDDRAERFLTEMRFHAPLTDQAMHELLHVGKRTNFIRKEFLSQTICMVRSDLAFHLEKGKSGVRLFVHVPDVCEDIYPGTVLDKELRYKGFCENLVPEVLRQRLGFSLKAKTRTITAVLEISCLGAVRCVDYYRSRIICTTQKAPQLFGKIKQFLPAEHEGVHPVQQAAERALAQYFASRRKTMPYAGVLLHKSAEVFLPYLTLKGYSAFTEQTVQRLFFESERDTDASIAVLKSVLFTETLSTQPVGALLKVPFGNPFQSFAAILTQWALVYHGQKHHNKEENIRFEDYMKECVAVYRQQQIYFAEYHILRNKENWLRKNREMQKTACEGTVLGFQKSVETGLCMAVVLHDGNLIYCRNVPENVAVGETVKVSVSDAYKGAVMLTGQFLAKEDF